MSAMVMEPILATQFVILGDVEMVLANGEAVRCDPSVAHAMRVDTPTAISRISHPQTLRHVGVSMPLARLAERFCGSLPELAGQLAEPDICVNRLLPVTVTSAFRTLAVSLWRDRSTDILGRLACNGQAMQFYAMVVGGAVSSGSTSNAGLEPWETDAVQTIAATLAQNLRAPLDMEQLAQSVRMSPARLDTAFRDEIGQTMPVHHQSLRFAEARRRLTEGSDLVKQIAFDAGYDHVSNFSRASQRFHGESPRRTRERGQV